MGREIASLVLDGFYEASVRQPFDASQIFAVGTDQGVIEALDMEDELTDSTEKILIARKFFSFFDVFF